VGSVGQGYPETGSVSDINAASGKLFTGVTGIMKESLLTAASLGKLERQLC